MSSSSLREGKPPGPMLAFLSPLRPNYRTLSFARDGGCAARAFVARLLYFEYHRPVPAPLARARSRVHPRRARIHAAAGRRRVHGTALATTNCARSLRPFYRAHSCTSAPPNFASTLLRLNSILGLYLLYSYILTPALLLRALLPEPARSHPINMSCLAARRTTSYKAFLEVHHLNRPAKSSWCVDRAGLILTQGMRLCLPKISCCLSCPGEKG
jgi:hypothetical protein